MSWEEQLDGLELRESAGGHNHKVKMRVSRV